MVTGPELMTTREVAALLRIKERKVYDLAASAAIPCVRVTGKLLFPRALIEAWLVQHSEYSGGVERLRERPPVCAGSHDPLLDWALREAGSGIAVHFGGSLDGLRRLARGEAVAAGVHLHEDGEDAWNGGHVARVMPGQPVVLVEWARRAQGLIVAPGNPLGIRTLADLKGRRFAGRQQDAGAALLFRRVLSQAGYGPDLVTPIDPPALTETEVAAAVADDKADAGFGIAAAARSLRLNFVPVIEERYDLAVWRAAYFDPPIQALMAFACTGRFAEHAAALGGYNVSGLGRVHYNGP